MMFRARTQTLPSRHTEMSSASSPHLQQGGFTLIETLMVIALVALLAAVIAPNMIPTPNNQLRANASELKSALRETRLHAMRMRKSAALLVDTANKSYQLPNKTQTQALSGELKVQLTTAQKELVDDDSGYIRFYPDGSSTGGRITLSNDDLIQHVDIAWLTGRVRLLENTP
mgnify:CR=1 FL=1